VAKPGIPPEGMVHAGAQFQGVSQMSNLFKKWAIVAATTAGMMFALSGCLGGKWYWITAILNEDIFG